MTWSLGDQGGRGATRPVVALGRRLDSRLRGNDGHGGSSRVRGNDGRPVGSRLRGNDVVAWGSRETGRVAPRLGAARRAGSRLQGQSVRVDSLACQSPLHNLPSFPRRRESRSAQSAAKTGRRAPSPLIPRAPRHSRESGNLLDPPPRHSHLRGNLLAASRHVTPTYAGTYWTRRRRPLLQSPSPQPQGRTRCPTPPRPAS